MWLQKERANVRGVCEGEVVMSEQIVVSDSGRLQELHPTAAAVYQIVLDLKVEYSGDSPSRREIADRLDVPVSVVHHHLVMLERVGLITLPAARDARRIGVPGAVWTPPDLERKDGGKVGERWGVLEGVGK